MSILQKIDNIGLEIIVVFLTSHVSVVVVGHDGFLLCLSALPMVCRSGMGGHILAGPSKCLTSTGQGALDTYRWSGTIGLVN